LATFPNACGFVLEHWYAPEQSQVVPISVRPSSREGTSVGPSFRLFVRALGTTPETVDEAQPVTTAGVILAYAGRIDNRNEVADRLGRPDLLRATDGAILAESYAAWGDTFPAKVLGEYSFALIDRRTGGLVAGRDSLGIGHLFHCEDAHSLWVASNLELLLDALPQWPSLDRPALAEYFASGGNLAMGNTIFSGIREMPAAHVIRGSRGKPVIRRYWQPNPERLLRGSSDDYDGELRRLLSEATRAAMRSSTPVWSDLSGGLDSSSVTAVAAMLTNNGYGPKHGLAAFSLMRSKTKSEEAEYQGVFLATYPLEHHTLDVDAHLPFANVDESPWCHPSHLGLYRPLTRAASKLFRSRGVHAHLNGRGGDVIFCGDHFPPVFLSELARGFKWGRWLRDMRQWARRGERSVANLLWHCSLAGANDYYAGEKRGTDIPRWIAPDFGTAVHSAISRPWQLGERLYGSPAREMLYRGITRISSTRRFITVGDERHPLLYRPLIEFVLALPWEHLVQPETDRVIQRRALRGILPEPIRTRLTKDTATHSLLRGVREGWSNISDVVQGRRIAQLGLVEPAAFRSACEQLRHGLIGNHLRYLIAALSLEMWLRSKESHGRSGGSDGHFWSLTADPVKPSPDREVSVGF
jgi:asparagine synthase (glutamine-hydrolysing)